jgi:hypothetical protein
MPKRTRAEVAKAKQKEEEEEEKKLEEIPNEEEEPKQDGKQQSDAADVENHAEEEEENLTTFQLPFKKDKHIPCEARTAPNSGSSSLIFTHGAGGGHCVGLG